ncbi:hypothetical protein ANCDUO_04343 [Ancylostoma duodenale]|uniref:Uncharacterized protein n=1 Tax=Ancylostoma duodenale TaxID=51022 RepID=A0A0C2D6U2_9BILA|nr:hypothetical protein ANCDUO_04343 [Ancylostoma duodenale]
MVGRSLELTNPGLRPPPPPSPPIWLPPFPGTKLYILSRVVVTIHIELLRYKEKWHLAIRSDGPENHDHAGWDERCTTTFGLEVE